MKSYKVLSPLNHDNAPYEPGEEIGLDDRTAKPLLEGGVIEPVPEQETTDPGDQSLDGTGDDNSPDAETVEAKSETADPEAADTNQAEATARPSRKAKGK